MTTHPGIHLVIRLFPFLELKRNPARLATLVLPGIRFDLCSPLRGCALSSNP